MLFRSIPDRQREGYGPNAPALLRLKEEGAAVVVTVDCGITAHAPLQAAAEAGLEVVVIDQGAIRAALVADGDLAIQVADRLKDHLRVVFAQED